MKTICTVTAEKELPTVTTSLIYTNTRKQQQKKLDIWRLAEWLWISIIIIIITLPEWLPENIFRH